jgi:hypothetical protein
MTKPWWVVFEVRQKGAIGEFETRGMSSPMENKEDAIDEVRVALAHLGYETRAPRWVYQYEEN